MKSLAVPLIVLSIVVVGIFSVNAIVLGGRPVVSLAAAPALTGQIAQAFTNNKISQLPVPGRDFNLKNTRYFESNEWVVTDVNSLGNTVTNGTVVLQQQSGGYEIVLGPGTSFPTSYARNLPTDVYKYLSVKGLLYDSTTE